ncbi:alcohol dehydrogenase catalytic domain-containing protein [Natronolimnohabitans innermongolicus]|uniref:Alcohol dehydrogenase zinc-binding domain protein n=1 Tax=Natronolimnohabitans innermongolicus JCM 12255 TaxID=1227499 RepID=L9WPU0_9EURY|nr:zinc-binding dehydrogenase [Natronolimnohabitans innermongolicus]ELY50363.1 alcohol dehydrogenase zinc-binding domain protein [Natronolimnohabitans innermongolicus JCM 12255]
MRAAAFTGIGSPEHVDVESFPDPEPGPGEAVLEVEACSINHHDLWILRDGFRIDEDELPYVAGMDVAGTVSAIGDDVDGVEPGDEVLLCPNQTCGSCRYCREGPENLCERFDLYHGGLAEYAAVEADRLIALPDGVEPAAAAAIPVAYMTAFRMLEEAEVGPGDLVFVPGATGGVGVAAIQLADVLGARTIGTSTSREKLDRLETLGADHVVESGDPDEIREAVTEIGRVDVTINHLGGPYSEVGLNVLRRGGRMAICGQTAGPTSTLTMGDLFLNHKRVIGSTMGTQRDLERLVDLVADRRLEPVVYERYSLEDADRAFADMDDRNAVGKLVVEP